MMLSRLCATYESRSPTNIPEELVLEILVYLPVKSLIRFTIVCKSWSSLIRNDHQFAMKNYLIRTTSSSKVLDNADYMFDIQRSREPCLYAFDEAKTFRFLKKFVCGPEIPLLVSNSCHGIICFYLYSKGEVLLCNPAIQELVLLPPCPNMDNMTALGFDSINNDYKVVAFPFLRNRNYPCTVVDVYSLRRRQWRTVQVSDSRCNFSLKAGQVALGANGRMCNWLAYKNMDKTDIIVSFDVVEDVLKEVTMPTCRLPDPHDHQMLSSTRWQACLSCFPKRWDFNGRFIHVWVLKDWVWSKELAVQFPDHEPMRPFNFWFNDHELLVAIPKSGTDEEVLHYDLDTQQLKPTRRNEKLWYSRGYVESLVSIKHLISLRQASVQENDDGYLLREVRRKGARLFKSFKLISPSV